MSKYWHKEEVSDLSKQVALDLETEIEYALSDQAFKDIVDDLYKCPKCKCYLEQGIFLEDGHATDDPNTMYIFGRRNAKADQVSIEACWKCPSCGYSCQIDLDEKVQYDNTYAYANREI